ncbi:FUSC family protein [Parasediminibacterium sp. JCM 36343]|uniref:FUSC family protein n=1 Tax=Parasediminibacterium sp. JCM 36343 TaxID=3374279 RepID=UPI0039797ACA
MSERIKSLLIYAAKCATGSLAVYTISSLIHYTDIGWCLISVMLVLSADGKDSVPLAITRIKANLVGAGVGVLCLLVSPTNMWILSIALTITVAFCYLFTLDTGIRSALAATIIIMLHGEGKHVWDTAIERIIAVLAGCLLGLLITFIFHFKISNNISSGDNHQEA